MSDPPRLLDDASTHELLRAGLEAGRAEVPNTAQLDSLAAKLGPLLGPGGGGGPPIDPSLPMKLTASVAAKSLGGLALVATGVTAAVLLLSPPNEPATPTPRPSPSAPETPTEPTADARVIPVGVEMPDDVIEPPSEPSPRPAPRPRPSYEVDPSAELGLIRQAQNALRSSPARALELTAEHERRFGPGSLAQEREVVAIDALHQTGRDAAARQRAARFRRTWPQSAHLRRIDVILGAPE